MGAGAPPAQPNGFVPHSPPSLPNGGHVNGHADAATVGSGSPYPEALGGAPPAADAPPADPDGATDIAADGVNADLTTIHPQALAATAYEAGGAAGEAGVEAAGVYDAYLAHEHGHAAEAAAVEGYGTGDAADAPQYAAAPPEGMMPSPWVSYWYSDWPSETWAAVFEHSPELFYYHFQMKTQAEGWGDVEWQEYREQNPEHCEHIEYFNVEWGMRGTPMWPMPQEGEPLIGGGLATAEWLGATQAAIAAAQADGDEGVPPTADPAEAYLHEHGVADGVAEALDDAGAAAAVEVDEYAAEALSEEVTLMQPGTAGDGAGDAGGQATPRMLSADALVAADMQPAAQFAEDAPDRSTNGHAGAEAPGYFPGSATVSPSGKLLNLDDLDYVPDMQQVQEFITRYAVPMRPESCAGSDDDRLYAAQPGAAASPSEERPSADGDGEGRRGGHVGQRGPVSSRSSSSSGAAGSAGEDDEDDDGPYPGQDAEDVEDGVGDMGSMLAVASPSSCHRHDEEARVHTGALGTAVAAADSAAAMRHLEAALETQQVRGSMLVCRIVCTAAVLLCCPPVQ